MKLSKFIVILFVLGHLSNWAYGTNYIKRNTLVIGCRPAGLFSNFFGVINNLIWCEKTGTTPVVYWGEQSLYYRAQGHNDAKNSWEYYFETVSHETYLPGDNIHCEYHALDGSTLNLGADYATYIISYQDRVHVKSFIDKFIKIKRVILDKVNNFYAVKMKNILTIGIHIKRN